MSEISEEQVRTLIGVACYFLAWQYCQLFSCLSAGTCCPTLFLLPTKYVRPINGTTPIWIFLNRYLLYSFSPLNLNCLDNSCYLDIIEKWVGGVNKRNEKKNQLNIPWKMPLNTDYLSCNLDHRNYLLSKRKMQALPHIKSKILKLLFKCVYTDVSLGGGLPFCPLLDTVHSGEKKPLRF